MKKINLFSLIFAALMTVFAFSGVKAQDGTPTADAAQNLTEPVRPIRILQELGLSQEQIQQIRRINAARKPIMQEAQRKRQMANRNLDLAIYADNTTEEEIKARLREAQLAHNEFMQARALTEYLIRKVLTPEQLQKFRQLREEFLLQMNNPNNQRQRPLNRIMRRGNQNRP
jgi:Spy/CpxP family protein refolding chaperone